jgi:predicted permease
LLGRTLRADDQGCGGAPVVVLSHAVWQNRFGGDPEIIGRSFSFSGDATTVVGVMPPEFEYPPGRELWEARQPEGFEPTSRVGGYWQVVGKLAPDVGVAAAQAELDTIAAQLAAEYPANRDVGIAAVPLDDRLVEQIRPALLMLLGAVGLVLLIACVNVASLLLARAAKRRRELAIRGVLGAGSTRILRQLATESLVLAVIGGGAGLALAAWGLGALDGLLPAALPRDAAPTVDVRLVLFVSALALGTALLFGLAPALQGARADLRTYLHSTLHSGPAARRFRGALVVGELALATVLLIGAGLLVRSFGALLDVERGYRTDNVLSVTVQAWRQFPEPAQRAAFVTTALERIAALPGVVAAGVGSSLPLAENIGAETASFSIVGRPPPAAGNRPVAQATLVAGDYFGALGIPLRRGRLFEPTDDADSQAVVLVDEAMVRQHWPGEDPVGARLNLAFAGPPVEVEVVGVVGDIRDRSLEIDPGPGVYLPHAQRPDGALHFITRSSTDAAALTRAVQAEISALAPAMPFWGTTTLDVLLDDSLRARRFTLLLTLAFSLTALALAAIGTYGVLSYESSRRSHEIGVRMALGARRHWVLRLVVGEGLRLALVGVVIGALLALALTRSLSSFLYGVSPFDPVTFGGIAMLLIAVTALASYLPARRAAGVDPMRALREE